MIAVPPVEALVRSVLWLIAAPPVEAPARVDAASVDATDCVRSAAAGAAVVAGAASLGATALPAVTTGILTGLKIGLLYAGGGVVEPAGGMTVLM